MITFRYLSEKSFFAQKLVKLQQSRVTWVVTHAELTEKTQIPNFSVLPFFLQTKPRVTLVVTQVELTKKTHSSLIFM